MGNHFFITGSFTASPELVEAPVLALVRNNELL